MTRPEATVQRGRIIVYRVFDVAEEIDLARVERILSQAQVESRVRLDQRTRPAVFVRNAPIRARLGEVEFALAGLNYKGEALATIHDYGVISISFHLPIPPGTAWSGLIATAEALTILAHWLGEWRFVDAGQKVRPAGMVTLRPAGGLRLSLERR